MARKKPKIHRDERGEFVWEIDFVRGKQKRSKRRIFASGEKIYDDPDELLREVADEVTLHQMGCWDLIEERRTAEINNGDMSSPEESKSMKADPKKLPIDIRRLEDAFDQLQMMSGGFDDFDELPITSFLNLTTGEIVPPETWDEHEKLSWDKNFLRLPEDLRDYASPRTSLENFVAGLKSGPVRKALNKIRPGKGIFRKFKSVIFDSGDVEAKRAWGWFETVRQREMIVQWLETENIEPVWSCELFEPPTYPDKRADLLRAVLQFVRDVRDIDSVRRIALIGSLTTDKVAPKDVDLLVEIENDASLKTLAMRSRQLLGRTVQTGDSCGTDVFLCNPELKYLGRVCEFKQCRAGIRASCLAQHCGRTEYLNDDLDNVTLDRDTMAKPPLNLWPQVAFAGELPKDLLEILVAPLQDE